MCKPYDDLLKPMRDTILIIYLGYFVCVLPFLYYIIKGNGDTLAYIQEVLEIGTYKIIIMTLPALVNDYYKYSANDMKQYIHRCLMSGLSAALAFAAFSITLRLFLPSISPNIERISYLESRYHSVLYLKYDFLLTIVFHSSIIGACGILVSGINQAVRCYMENQYTIFPATFLIVQFLSVLSSICKIPNYLCIYNIYSGYYRISDSEALNVLWAYLFCFLHAIPFGFLFFLKRRRNLNAIEKNGEYR